MAEHMTEKKAKFVEAFWEAIDNGVEERMALNIARLEAGYSDKTDMSAILKTIDLELLSKANIEIKLARPKAIRRIKSVLNDPEAKGATNALAAAASVLDRAGLVKKESKEVNVTMPSGIAFMPHKLPVNTDDITEE